MGEHVSKKLVDFFIIGVQKSATSSLAEDLEKHSSIAMPAKEVNIFLTENELKKNKRLLLNLFGLDRSKLVGIKCPDYFSEPRSIHRIRRYNKDAKLIIIYRDPVERFVSAAFWYMQVGLLPVQDINSLIEECVFSGKDNTIWHKQLIEYGFYGKYYDELVRVFPRENLLVIEQEKYRDNSVEIVERIWGFLGLGSVGVDLGGSLKKQSIYNLSRLRLYSIFNKNFFYRFVENENVGYSVLRPKYFRIIFYFWKVFDNLFIEKMLANQKPVVRPDLLAALEKLYHDDYKYFKERLVR